MTNQVKQSIKITNPEFTIKIVATGKKILKKEQRILELSCDSFYRIYGTIRAKDIANDNVLRKDIGKEIIKKINFITITVKTQERLI